MMEIKKVLSVGRRLQAILEEAESESQKKLTDARKRAEEIVSKARAQAEEKKAKAQRGSGIDDLIKAEEIRATKEAEKIKVRYQEKIDVLKKLPKKNRDVAVQHVLEEVLPK
jgi:vacuolar-type H+-ATPase subunit H